MTIHRTAASIAALALSTLSLTAAGSALARPMTATDMHMMHRLGAPSVSPDGRWALFTVSDTDLAKNRRKNVYHLLDLNRAGAQPVKLAGIGDGYDARFGGDGAIWYLGDGGALMRMVPGKAATKVGDLPEDIGGFKVSKDGSRLLVWADRRDCPDLGCKATTFAAPGPGSAKVYDELFVRHWDSWGEPGTRSRLYAFALKDGRISGEEQRLTGALTGDTPSKPFGGGEEIAISNDGRTAFFALRQGGTDEPSSTNLDIYMSPTDGSAAPVNLTADNPGTDNLPTLSPDGRTLAWLSMARAGYESDRNVIKLRDLVTGKTRALSAGWDRSPGAIAWTPDGKAIIADAQDTLENPLFRIDVATGKVTRLTDSGTWHNAVPLADGSVVATMNSLMAPDDLYRVGKGSVRALTALNRAALAALDPVRLTKMRFTGANNDTVWGFTLKPAAAATARLPIAFVVHGGPQGSFSNGWSYRWNSRLLTAPGYAVVSVDFHGSTGYGQAFTDSIRGNWGGWPLEDLKKGLAAATAADPQLDADKACALGASYGGYMMNWIEGNWPDRFKCIVQHDGMFDNRSWAYETEEQWFSDWDHGGVAPWVDPKAYERWNPVNHVAKWKTPMLVITGEKDYRVPTSQALMAFTALQRRKVPSRLVVFPDENHWVTKPNNSIRWYDEVFRWMDQWLGAGTTAAPNEG